MRIDFRLGIIVCTALAVAIAALYMAPIAQDPDYHRFADRRTILGIANFWNVVSNLPFLILGVLGTWKAASGRTPGYLPEMKPVYVAFFAGVACTGVASAYYHLKPDNYALLWDRLALTVLFMSMFSLICGEHLSIAAGRRMAMPLIAAGGAAAIFWYLTERQGQGDLRFYGLVQFLPLFMIPLILMLYPSRLSGVFYIWGLLGCYAVSKVAEVLDDPLYQIFSGLSGHEIKHWVAAMGIFIYYLAGFRRRRRFE